MVNLTHYRFMCLTWNGPSLQFVSPSRRLLEITCLSAEELSQIFSGLKPESHLLLQIVATGMFFCFSHQIKAISSELLYFCFFWLHLSSPLCSWRVTWSQLTLTWGFGIDSASSRRLSVAQATVHEGRCAADPIQTLHLFYQLNFCFAVLLDGGHCLTERSLLPANVSYWSSV